MNKRRKILYLIFSFFIWLLIDACAYAQVTLSTPSLGFTQACASPSFNSYNFSFSVAPVANLGAGNQFIVEMSNATGSFASPTVVATLPTTTTIVVNGSFSIPLTSYGEGYRIRVRSTVPAKTSPSSVAFPAYYAIHNQPYSINNNVGTVNICSGTTYNLSIDNTGTPASPLYYASLTYKWYKDYVLIPGETGSSITVSQSGSYYVVTNFGSCVFNSYSNIVTVAIQSILTPQISTSDGLTQICPGNTKTLTSDVQDSNFTYTWYRDNVVIPGAVLATYNASQAGIYHLVITGGGCIFETNDIELELIDFNLDIDPAVTTAIIPGQSITLTAITDAASPTYQWYKNNVAISGATQSTYNATTQGTYKVAVNQATPCNTTKEASVEIVYPDSFNLAIQPNAAYQSCTSTTATLNISQFDAVTGGIATNLIGNSYGYTYQWYKDGTAVAGATANVLNITTAADNGSYTLEVTLPDYGIVTSNAVAVNLSTGNVVISGPVTICEGAIAALTSSVTNAAYTYQWYKDGALLPAITTPTLAADSEGDYYLKVTYGGCTSQSNTIHIDIENISISSTNPSTDIILPGQAKALTVTTDALGPQYVWYRNNVALAETTATLNATLDGTYKVVVTQTLGCNATAESTFVLNYPTGFTIAIAANAGYTACTSTTATLSVSSFEAQTPSGNVNVAGLGYTYQWYRNNVPVAGATSASLVLNNSSQNGDYRLEATVPYFPAVISNTITVNLAMEPVTVSAGGILCTGGTTTLSASPNNAAYTYQWYKNGSALTGETAATLTADSAGNYYVAVTSGTCSTQSNTLNLQETIITVNVNTPATDVILPGQTKTITVTTDAGAPTYEWYRNNILLAETSDTLTATQDGTYKVVVNQTAGCTTSAETTFVLNYPTGFNLAIAADAAYVSCNSTIASLDVTAFTATIPSGTIDVSALGYQYQWYKNNVAVAGATSQTLIISSASQNGVYKLEATVPDYGVVTSNNVTVNVAVESIVITNAAALCEGSTVIINANVSDAGYTYQWYKNSTAITGETTPVLTVSTAGNYYLVVSGGTCTAQSNTINLQVSEIAVSTTNPATDIIFPGQTKTLSVTTDAVAPTYAWYRNNVLIATATGPTYTATQDGEYKVVVTQTSGCAATEEKIFMLEYPTGFTITVAANAGYTACTSSSATLTVTSFTATTPSGSIDASALGYTYQWYKGSTPVSGATSSSLILNNPSQNGNYKVVVTIPDFAPLNSNTVAVSLALPVGSVVVTKSGPLCTASTVVLSSSITDTGYSYQWYKNGLQLAGATASSLTTGNPGDYYLVVTAGACTSQSNTLALQTASIVINSTNPATDIILPGQTKNITVTTDATAPTYAWYRNNVLLPDTGASITATQDGDYKVIVTETAGCTITAQKIFTLQYPTGFTITIAANAGYTPCATTPVTLSVTAFSAIIPTGTVDVSSLGYQYQWYNGSVPVAGATSSTLTLTDASQNGNYKVVATVPDFAPINSNNVSVNIAVPAGAVTISQSGTLCSGSTVALTSAITGTAYTYQWYKNGSALAGATSSSFMAGTEGNYYLVVTAGTCTSQSNTLNVTEAQIVINSTNPVTDVILPGDSKILTVTTDAVAPIYAWYRNNVLLSETSASLTVTEDGEYKVVVTQTSGCNATQEKIFTLQYPTGFTITIAPDAAYADCTSVTATLQVSSFTAQTPLGDINVAVSGYLYQWYKDNSPLVGETSQTLSLSGAAQNGEYKLQVTIPQFSPVFSNAVVVKMAMDPVVITNSGVLCDGSTVDIVSGVANPSYTYQWYKDGLSISGATSSVYTASQEGDYYLIVAYDGCTIQSNTLNLQTTGIAINSTNPDTDIILPGQTKTITVTTDASGPQYTWYKDGVLLTETSATLTATQNGTYKVVVLQTLGCNATQEKIFTLNYPTGFQITVATDASYIACTSNAVTLNVSNFIALAPNGAIDVMAAGYQYQWYKNNAPLTGETNAALTLNDSSQNGTYKVEAAIPDFAPVFSNDIAVNLGLGTVTLTSSGSLCDTGSQVVFISNITNTDYTYTWYKDGVMQTTENTPDFTTTLPGDYYVEVTNGICTTSSNTLNIQQSDFDLTATGPLTGIIIPGETKILSVTTTAQQPTYVWYRNGIIIAGEETASLTATLAGEYKVVVTQTQDCILTKELLFDLTNPSGFALTIAAQNYESCVSTEANLYISEFKAITDQGIISLIGNDFDYAYQWYKDGGVIPGATDVAYLATETGIYSLEVNIPGFGIVNSNGIAVEVAFTDHVTITMDGVFCTDGSEVTLYSDITNEEYLYAWYHDGATLIVGADSNVTVSEMGSYYLEVSYNGCTVTSNTLVLEPYDIDQFVISVDENVDLPEGTTKIVTASGADSYTWYFNGEEIATGDSIEVSEPGTYMVKAQIGECEVTRQFVVAIKENNLVAIPNVITPNGDGINDTWALPLKYISEDIEIMIYSPDGTLILRQSPYNNSWPESDFLWLQKDPVFYYTIMEGTEIIRRGSITFVK